MATVAHCCTKRASRLRCQFSLYSDFATDANGQIILPGYLETLILLNQRQNVIGFKEYPRLSECGNRTTSDTPAYIFRAKPMARSKAHIDAARMRASLCLTRVAPGACCAGHFPRPPNSHFNVHHATDHDQNCSPEATCASHIIWCVA